MVIILLVQISIALQLEDYDFESKSESRRSFEEALEKLGCAPENAVMVEDLVKNLKIPHEMGMKTVLIHHGKPPEEIPDFVDYHCNSALNVLEAVQKSQGR